MSLTDLVTFVFFIGQIAIFLIKILNLMGYKYEPGKLGLKYYGKEYSIVLFIISLFAWLIMFTSFSARAAESNFFLTYGITTTMYLQYGVYFSISSLLLIFTLVFTFIELILEFNDHFRVTSIRQRREFYNRK